MTERFFTPCPRGLEAKLAAELTALDAQFVAPVDGGVSFAGPLEIAYRINLESRLASRVLWQVAHGAIATRTTSMPSCGRCAGPRSSGPNARCGSMWRRPARR